MILDLNDAQRSEIAYRRFSFPDGQPHIAIADDAHAKLIAEPRIDIVVSIRSASDLIDLALVVESIRSIIGAANAKPVMVNVSYLLGARMDRRIAPGQPDTLAVIAGTLSMIESLGCTIFILDPHSSVATTCLPNAQVMHPDALIAYAVASFTGAGTAAGDGICIVIPDKGALARTTDIVSRLKLALPLVQCSKKRDSQTGKLSGFQIDQGVVEGKVALIVDDICDGGGTFSGIAAVLRERGARQVHLAVTHGIFSKGIEIAGIDSVFTTDSYRAPDTTGFTLLQDAKNASITHYQRDGVTKLTLWNRFVCGQLMVAAH